MGASKRDGFYKRGRVWWTRDPITKRRTSTGCSDFEAARLWRARRERLAADPAHAAAQTSRLGEWISRWLTMKAQTASDATMAVARQKLGHWVRVLGADRPLAEVTPALVDEYVALRREEQVSDHTISKELTHLVSVLRLAKRGGCYPLELETLRPPDLHAGYVPRKRALTRAELAALLSELEPERGALVAVCVALGCRWGEAMRLLPTDIEADRVLIRGTKTSGARRYVPILSLYRPLLDQATPWLPLRPWQNRRRGLLRACARAGIEAVTPNDLRRTHSTLLVEAGVDRDVVRRLLGHTTTAMVDRVYGQPKTEALAALAEERLAQVPGLLSGEVATPRPCTRTSQSEGADRVSRSQLRDLNSRPTVYEAQPGDPESAAKSRFGRKHAGKRGPAGGVVGGEHRGACTRTSQLAGPGAWALGLAAERLGLGVVCG